MTLSGIRSHGYWSSPVPRAASGKMRTSIACILPSVRLTPVEAAPDRPQPPLLLPLTGDKRNQRRSVDWAVTKIKPNFDHFLPEDAEKT